ncbi:MAG: LysR family transcriptional regulator [Thiogranum sp.]|nr:LysR family transcriptional regulator [Thiogranum sp.]
MPRLTLRQLEILEAVARCGSFSRASNELHLSQPAVSMQVKQLEGSLGLPLFEHMGKHIQLTEAGRETLRTGRAIGRELANLEHALADLQGLKGGTLTVSVASTASYFAARLMALFRQVHPDVRISLNVVNRETLLQHLTGNSIDLALMGQPPQGHDLTAQPFMDNPLVVIAAPGHPLAVAQKIPLARFVEEPLVGREQGSGTRSAVEKFLAEHDLSLTAAMEMNKNEAIKQAVEAGLGLGVVSLHTVKTELATGQLCVLDVQGFPLQRQWYLVQREGKRLSPAAQAFAQFVLNEAARLTG